MFLRRKKAFEGPVEWLIVGLGNPGPEYAGTRHNIGFEVIDRVAQQHHIKVKWAKHQALFGTGAIQGVGVALAKPMTFMNLSGRAVVPLMRHFQLSPDRVLIVADEVDLPFGRIQLKPKGGSAGHNGHKSIQQYLKTDQYPRLRIGIGKPEDDKIDHVLGRFGREEVGRLDDVLGRGVAACEAVVYEGLERALSRANAGQGPDTA